MKKIYSILHIICIFLILGALMLTIYSCTGTSGEIREYGWFDFVIPDLDTSDTEVNLAFLNDEEAGSTGFITVKDGHFIDGNGKRIKFFGDNLTFGSCFLQKDTATIFAARLKKLGMNVIRFHHMDMNSAPGGIWNQDMTDLDSGQLERLDWLIYQLKLNGIYTNLNTHVSRTYPGVDYPGIGNFNFGKAIDQFYRPYIEMQKDYAKKLLTHLNPYTGNTYADEPAVAFVEVNNENSLLSAWRVLPDLRPDHKNALIAQWKAWVISKPRYPKNADLMNIIGNYDKQDDLRKEMLWGFLMDTEMSYAKEMTTYYKNELKIHGLVCITQASYSWAQGMLRESTYADFIDMHAYWEHPSFPNRPWSRTDWLIRNSSMVSDKQGGTLARFGHHRVAGMPYTITEYDHPAPSFFCAEMYPMLNAVAAFQDFDGIYHFDTNEPFGAGKILNFFATAGHPLKQVFIPAGAVIFRMNAVQPGNQTVRLDLPRESVLKRMVGAAAGQQARSSGMGSIWEDAGAPPALILMHPMSVNMNGEDLKLSDVIASPAGPWDSETGELSWDNRDSVNAVF
ncbi:MAG TPA: hypothetical protein VI583_03965, partial [Cyclobacteriaceae bacterium]|nr:hypothetical protein [Cyclobacteriaceae bacterium]